jgi:2-C-methyl-D-erythritol 4-phosphate cytidylyltransferase
MFTTMRKKEKVGVIIPAGGLGKRFGGEKPKQLVEINGVPVLQQTLQKFQTCPAVDFIVVSLHPKYITDVEKIIKRNKFTKIISVVSGGQQRQDSVWNAMREIVKHQPDIILIHDAVRPFVSGKLILKIIQAAKKYEAAVPTLASKDTIKISDGKGFLINTPDRNTLFAVQTPQGFKTKIIVDAFKKASADKFYGTDDASLVERLGKKVKIVEGEYRNIKITTKEDIHYASYNYKP